MRLGEWVVRMNHVTVYNYYILFTEAYTLNQGDAATPSQTHLEAQTRCFQMGKTALTP